MPTTVAGAVSDGLERIGHHGASRPPGAPSSPAPGPAATGVVVHGHLNPGDPEVRLERAPLGLDDLARQVWISRWSLPPGQERPQHTLTHPACNLVVEPHAVDLHGPRQALSVVRLRGTGWVVGVLFRPGVTSLLTGTAPAALVGRHEPVPPTAGALGDPAGVLRLMRDLDPGTPLPTAELVGHLHDALAPLARQVDPSMLLVNEVCRLADEHLHLRRATDLAAAAGVSVRTLNRVVARCTGLTPTWLLACRRLQAGASILFADPQVRIADLADRLGYADQAHFTRSYRAVFGETPARTRRRGVHAAVLRTPVPGTSGKGGRPGPPP